MWYFSYDLNLAFSVLTDLIKNTYRSTKKVKKWELFSGIGISIKNIFESTHVLLKYLCFIKFYSALRNRITISYHLPVNLACWWTRLKTSCGTRAMLNTLELQTIVLNFLIFGDPLFVNLVPRPFSQKHDLETER